LEKGHGARGVGHGTWGMGLGEKENGERQLEVTSRR